MKNFSPLTQKTLTGMPVLLDSIVLSVEQLTTTFLPIYEDLGKLLNENLPSKFQVSNGEEGVIYLFSDDYKRRYLPSPQAFAEVRYKLEVEQNIKRTPIKFEIQFGYVCDDGHVCDGNQNVIYFQLIDQSEKSSLESLLEEIRRNVPAIWRTDFEENNIWIEFDVDETLSVDKIKQCAEDFKKYILLPVLDKLKE